MKPESHPSGKSRLAWIDVLRALAMGGIFLNHLLEASLHKWNVGPLLYLGWPDADWPPLDERFAQLAPLLHPSSAEFGATLLMFVSFLAEQTTSLFLLLSGYLLMVSIQKNQASEDYGKLLLQRARRLYPLWWTAFGILLFPLAFVGKSDVSLLDGQFYLKFLGIQYTPEQMFYGIPSWWYVPCLLQLFILAWPLSILARKYSAAAMLAVALVVGWAFRCWVMYWGLDYVNPWGSLGIVCLPEFALGMYLGSTRQGNGQSTSDVSSSAQFSNARVLASLFILAIAVPLAATKWGMVVVPLLRGLSLWWVLGRLSQYIAEGSASIVRYAMTWIGRHSYSIYLAHHFVILLLLKAAPINPEASWPVSVGWWMALLGLSLFGTYILSLFLEGILAACISLWERLANRYSQRIIVLCLGALTLTVLGTLLAANEWVLRNDPQELADFGWGERPALMPHEEFGWTLKPNSTTRLRWNSYDYEVTANSLGFPGPEYPRQREGSRLRVMVLGDAFASAEGVDTNEAWPRLLESQWNAESQPPLEVLNFAITGYGPQHYAAVAKQYVGEFQPDFVFVSLFVNDFEDVATTNKEFLDSIGFDKPEPDCLLGRLTGRQLVGYTKQKLKSWLVLDVLGHTDWRARGFCQIDAMDKRQSEFWETRRVAVATHLQEIREVCQQHGARVVVLGVPAPSQVCSPAQLNYWPKGVDFPNGENYDYDLPQQRMRRIAEDIDAPFLDLRPPLLEVRDQQPYFADNWHWTEVGHRAVMQYLIEWFEANHH